MTYYVRFIIMESDGTIILLLTLVSFPHIRGGADDGDLQEAGGDLPLGGDVDDEGEVDQTDGAQDGTGHAEAERAAHHLLWP